MALVVLLVSDSVLIFACGGDDKSVGVQRHTWQCVETEEQRVVVAAVTAVLVVVAVVAVVQ